MSGDGARARRGKRRRAAGVGPTHLRGRIHEQIENLKGLDDGEGERVLLGAIAVLRECAALLCERCGKSTARTCACKGG